MALVNYYLTDSEGDTDVEEDTPPVSFSAPTPVTEAAPPVEPPAGPRRPHWLPPVRPTRMYLDGNNLNFFSGFLESDII